MTLQANSLAAAVVAVVVAVGALGAARAQAPLADAGGSPQLHLPRAALSVGVHRIDAQVASTHEQRMVGLMHRRSMPQGEGMLFGFEQAAPQCFWMRNTLIPLTAAFVDEDGSIVNLADMQPLDESSHCSARPVRFVLEMNQGWFAQRHIQAGHRLRGPMFAKAAAKSHGPGAARTAQPGRAKSPD